jgi:hypothetical protein
MFGRRQREEPEEAVRERERRALFAELAKRPDTVCPFLGLAGARAGYHDGVTPEHRCYAFGDPADLSSEQQERVCLQRGYGNCPRYLRGVLVIPTEELEALRRPQPAAPPPTPPRRKVAPPAGGGRRRGPLLALVLVLLAAGGAGAGIMLLGNKGTAGVPTPTPHPTAVPTVSASPEPASFTPAPETPVPGPTPQPDDKFIGYEVTVLQGENTLFRVGGDGEILAARVANFGRFSKAPVDSILASNGQRHWRTSDGDYTGWSYIKGRSGPFLIREVYRASDGQLRYTILPDSEI